MQRIFTHRTRHSSRLVSWKAQTIALSSVLIALASGCGSQSGASSTECTEERAAAGECEPAPASCVTDSECDWGYECDLESGLCVDGGVRCEDADEDGFWDPSCEGVPIASRDCDDTAPSVNPGAMEICDGVDNDCDCTEDSNGDGIVCGPGDDGVDEETPETFCARQVGVCDGSTVACVGGEYPVSDCQDLGAYPDTYEAVETLCDGLDNDCDGVVDEDCPEGDGEDG